MTEKFFRAKNCFLTRTLLNEIPKVLHEKRVSEHGFRR